MMPNAPSARSYARESNMTPRSLSVRKRHDSQVIERAQARRSVVIKLNDLGVMLLALGRVDDAERALGEVVRQGGARDNVSNALIELMHCASYRRDRMGFERYRGECESRAGEMPPNILADFYFKAGIGSARFGNFRKAQDQLSKALDVAAKSGLD